MFTYTTEQVILQVEGDITVLLDDTEDLRQSDQHLHPNMHLHSACIPQIANSQIYLDSLGGNL
jgi:hypothetical protein